MSGEIELSGPDLTEEGIALDDLRFDLPAVGHVDGKPVVVVNTAQGPRAVGGQCTHYGAPLADGLCVDGEIRCPWHHAAFDMSTGEAVGGPALNPIPVYETDVRNDRVFVKEPQEVPAAGPAPSTSPESVVIVGAGAAGAAAAEAFRRHGYSGPISLIGEEPPVDRPNVSKDYLAGTAPEEWMPLRSAEYYADAGIDLITQKPVHSVDPETRTVRFADGESLTYGALLFATGAEPRRLPIDGVEKPHVHYLRTLEDSKSIIAALDEVKKAVVIGAGFIGLEVAASLRHRDIDVTVVAPEDIPLAVQLGETLGEFVRDLHKEHGVEFRLGTGVDRIDDREVILDDGSTLEADLVVVGIGVTPRTGLAHEAGLEVDDGVVVDDRLRSSDPNIWAAGDVARFPKTDGNLTRIEHWVLAQRHGQVAARNILGHDIAFTEPPFFWSQHYDVPINITGHVDSWDEDVVVGDPYQRDVIVGYRKNGTITAVASIYRDEENLRAEAALAAGDQKVLEGLLDR